MYNGSCHHLNAKWIFKTIEEGKAELVKKLNDGSTAHFLKDFIEAQHGDFSVIENYDQHFTTKHAIQIFAKQDGFLKFNSTDELGLLSMRLGAGEPAKKIVLILRPVFIYINHQTKQLKMAI
jgi:pyrimidine-nucleoside phosphorylase